MIKALSVLLVLASASSLAQTTASLLLEQRIARADPSKYRNMKAVHNGPGSMHYRPLFGSITPRCIKSRLVSSDSASKSGR